MADEAIRNCSELETRLTPFVDGEDAAAPRRAVEAHLAACPPCQQEADAEAAARALVHQHREQLRVAAPPALRARCAGLSASARVSARPASFVRRWAPLSLAATLVLAIAGVFLFGINKPVEALAASLTLDHVKCFTVADKDTARDAVAAAKSWQHDRGWEIVVPPPLPAEQLQLVDVRHCLSTEGRTAHLMYLWHGSPLSLYVLPADSGHAGSVRKMGRQTVIWCTRGRTYAVIADGQPRDLTPIVEYMKTNAR